MFYGDPLSLALVYQVCFECICLKVCRFGTNLCKQTFTHPSVWLNMTDSILFILTCLFPMCACVRVCEREREKEGLKF